MTTSNKQTLTCGVALCTFNGRAYLGEQLASLLAQERRPDQIAIYDDGSVDGSWEFVQEWAQNAPLPVSVHRHAERMGYVKNFEAAVQALDTDLIFLCDQDDIWLPNKISLMAQEFEEHQDLLLLHTDARLVDAAAQDLGVSLFEALRLSDNERQAVLAGNALEILCRRNLVTGATAAFRRCLLEIALPFPTALVHDEWLAIASATCGRMSLLDTPTILYRQHANNALGMPLSKWRIRQLLGAPSGQFHKRYAARQGELMKQISKLSSMHAVEPPPFLPEMKKHVAFRSNLPTGNLKRIASIFSEWKSGRYHVFSNGIRSVARDILNR
ncbi:glycosyl transferase 2 family protein [Collimonas arenae]|uniref:glycosyltransferase family 2 protein n=1 Tax=Collimonas arenae TaxID=279058 RepID=UPI0007786548|nr:glycosyltransferase family 2 protein [Collimonas arenae]AMO98701.1 glycosyl transferase 2 family protein [Collimonas arenae]